MLRTMIFFLTDDGTIQAIAQHDYAQLVSGGCSMPQYAMRRVRVADWYVRVEEHGLKLLNETYSVLYFDEWGRTQPGAEPGLIRDNKSLHVTAAADPYDKTAGMAHGDEIWSPTLEEHASLLRSCGCAPEAPNQSRSHPDSSP